MEHAHKHALRPYHAVAVCVRGSIAAERGDPEAGIHDLSTSLAEMRQANYLLFYPLFRTRLATIMDSIGRSKESAQEIDETLQLALDVGYQWIVPEILRVKGDLLQRHDPESVALSEQLFRRSIDQARAQDALYWELSAAASLTELLQRQGKSSEGRAILAPVYARLTEGRETPRALWAKGLLDRLG
jgi:non-specific serine/threonine protein kinase